MINCDQVLSFLKDYVVEDFYKISFNAHISANLKKLVHFLFFQQFKYY